MLHMLEHATPFQKLCIEMAADAERQKQQIVVVRMDDRRHGSREDYYGTKRLEAALIKCTRLSSKQTSDPRFQILDSRAPLVLWGCGLL